MSRMVQGALGVQLCARRLVVEFFEFELILLAGISRSTRRRPGQVGQWVKAANTLKSAHVFMPASDVKEFARC